MIKPGCYDSNGSTITLHCALQKLERSFAIPPFRCENLKHFTLMINCTPEIVRLSIDP